MSESAALRRVAANNHASVSRLLANEDVHAANISVRSALLTPLEEEFIFLLGILEINLADVFRCLGESFDQQVFVKFLLDLCDLLVCFFFGFGREKAAVVYDRFGGTR